MIFKNLHISCSIKIFILLYFVFFIHDVNAQKKRPLQIMDTVTNESDSATSVPGNDDGTVTFEKKDGNFFLRKELFSDHDTFQLRSVPDSIVKKMQDDDAFWYASHDFRKKATPHSPSFLERLLNQSWFRTLIWFLIIAGFISVLTWYLISSNVSIFRRGPGEIKQEETEDSTENIFEINFEKERSKAIAESHYRIAVRLMFLSVLKNLSQKDLILYKQGKTNFDYLLQMQPTKYYSEFSRITRNYEYSWYGQFEVDSGIYNLIRQDFDNFNRRF